MSWKCVYTAATKKLVSANFFKLRPGARASLAFARVCKKRERAAQFSRCTVTWVSINDQVKRVNKRYTLILFSDCMGSLFESFPTDVSIISFALCIARFLFSCLYMNFLQSSHHRASLHKCVVQSCESRFIYAYEWRRAFLGWNTRDCATFFFFSWSAEYIWRCDELGFGVIQIISVGYIAGNWMKVFSARFNTSYKTIKAKTGIATVRYDWRLVRHKLSRNFSNSLALFIFIELYE